MLDKSKIPIWDRAKAFPKDLEFILSDVLEFSDKGLQERVWARAEGPEVCWYSESNLSFDADIDYFKDLVRLKKVKITEEQVNAILKLQVLIWEFDELIYKEKLPEEWTAHQMAIINHPYFDKIRAHAKKTLELFDYGDV